MEQEAGKPAVAFHERVQVCEAERNGRGGGTQVTDPPPAFPALGRFCPVRQAGA